MVTLQDFVCPDSKLGTIHLTRFQNLHLDFPIKSNPRVFPYQVIPAGLIDKRELTAIVKTHSIAYQQTLRTFLDSHIMRAQFKVLQSHFKLIAVE